MKYDKNCKGCVGIEICSGFISYNNSNCKVFHSALESKLQSGEAPVQQTKATIALLAKCHAEIEIVANRIDRLRKLQGEIKVGIAQQ